MRGIFIGWVLVCSMAFGSDGKMDEALTALQPVFSRVVMADGTVAYQTLANEPELLAPLRAYATLMATLDGTSLSRSQQLAYYANAYNVFTLLGVMRAWPVASVRDIRPMFGFFSKDEWTVSGKVISLNTLEKKLLRPLDARIHFVINCASISCPKLGAAVLTPANVEECLQAAALAFLRDETKNQFDQDRGLWQLSKVFDWYRGDWGKEADVVAFIRSCRPELSEPGKIDYQAYDWGINAVQSQQGGRP